MRWVKIALNLFLGLIGVGALLILAGHFGYLNTVKPFIVQSGSMAPTIPVGSVVLVRAAPQYLANDVVSFKQNGSSKNTVTHRILSKQYPDGVSGEPVYITIGDANEDVDSGKVSQSDIIGKVYFTVPFIGYAVDLAKDPKGFILFVIVPATIIVYEELRSIQKELARLFRRRKSHPELDYSHPERSEGSLGLSENLAYARDSSATPQNDIVGNQTRMATAEEVVVINRGIPKAAIVVPILGSLLVFVALSAAFFLDNEQSTQNVLSAASSFATPTPTPSVTPTSTPTPTPNPNLANHVVISEVQIRGANANEDFVELYNPTNSAVDLNGWQIQSKSSPGTITSLVLIGSGESIPAHGYFLWSNNQGTFETDIGADVSNANNLSPNNSIALEDPSNVIVDQLGWGNGTNQYFEGSLFTTNPDINANQSLERKALSTSTTVTMDIGGADEFKGNGFDANNNPTDFVLRAVSQPQNSGSAAETP